VGVAIRSRSSRGGVEKAEADTFTDRVKFDLPGNVRHTVDSGW
jgi:hypothetical protein